MAQNLKTIQIPAEVQLSVKDQAKTMRTIADNLNNIFSNADPGSAFAKSYAKAMAVVEKKLMSSDALLGKDFFSEADLSKVSKYLNDVAEKMAEMRVLAQNTPTMTLGFETKELIEATKALAELQARIRETKGAKIGTIAGMNDKPAIKRMLETAEHSNFSTGKSFDENQAAMGKQVGKLSQQVRTYELEAERAKAASEEAEEAARSAKTALEEAADVLKAREAVNKKVASQVGAIDTTVSRKNNVTKTSIVQQYKDLISQQVVNGSWIDGGEDFARIIAGWLQVPQDALIGPAEDVVRNLHKAIGTAMRGSDISTNVLKRNAKSILNGESAALQQDASYREAENNVQIADAASQAASREAEDAQRVLTNANNNLTQTQELLNKIVAQMEELRELQREYNQLVDANNANDVNNARQRKAQADKNSRQQQMPYVDEGVEGLGSSSRNVTNALSRQVQGRVEDQARQNAANQARQEAEQFKQNLQHAINQWMSAQQVINLVKQGIRQAYQDIQGLDKAMTNIAVVTDMSVSDLWGKINEYMSIAQQYGVTTQGVYEVSQLYYQQGLSTNEVMAATTETLKMARIAGMGYAEAADAMTVAIRAFKMEMSDAGHVTDVYSKVAAVTASDTEELAIAMSKTASSAESVGSSFENTTAMLAVMVETTRESAQNLGSALKSIISRYGEMKQGLTQDSDGEIIDYNKTDAALRSIGISIKDAQGQFRDFDDVIFELSEKWDSLDKNTQRYIATIMAGNRQQSRFIALVDNWERLDEVATAAQDSEDAGLLQYAKTLDSLETRLNNISTSFQQFYMSIFNGPVIGSTLDFINNFIKGLNKLSKFTTILNFVSVVNGIKLAANLIIGVLSQSFTSISSQWRQTAKEMATIYVKEMGKAGKEGAIAIQMGTQEGQQEGARSKQLSKRMKYGARAASLGGMIFSVAGSSLASTNQTAGAIVSGIGNGLSTFAMLGPLLAAVPGGPIIAGVVSALSGLTSVLTSIPSAAEKAKEALNKATEASNTADIERAEARSRVNNLQQTLDTLKRLEEAQYDSEEARQEFINASNTAFEQFPELSAAFDEMGNAIINAEASEWLLIEARQQAANAALKAAEAEYGEAQAEWGVIQTRKEEHDIYSLLDEVSIDTFGFNTYFKDAIPGQTELSTFSFSNIWRQYASLLNDSETEYSIYDDILYSRDKNSGGDWSVERDITSKERKLMSDFVFMASSASQYSNGDLGATYKALASNNAVLSLLKSLGANSSADQEAMLWSLLGSVSGAIGTYNTASEYFSEEAQIEQQETINKQRQEAASRALVIGQIQNEELLLESDQAEAIKNLNGATELLQDRVYQQVSDNIANTELVTEDKTTGAKILTDTAKDKINSIYQENIAQFEALSSELSQNFALDDFNEILNIADKGGFTEKELDTVFQNAINLYDLTDEAKQAVQSFQEDYQKQIKQSTENVKAALKKNINFSAEVSTLDEILRNYIPEQYHNSVIDFYNYLDSAVSSGTITQGQAQEYAEAYIKSWEILGDETLNLSIEQIASARNLLASADLFSISGLQTLEQNLLDLGIDSGSIEKIIGNIPNYTANLITEYAQLESALAANLTNASEAMKKASEGMDLDEAVKMAQQLGVSVDDFEFIDGKWFYTNIDNIISYYNEETENIKEELENEAKRIVGLFGDQKYLFLNLDDQKAFESIVTAGEEERANFSEEAKEIYAAFNPYYANFTNWQAEMGDSLKEKTFSQQWQQYFESLGEEIDTATSTAMEYYTTQSKKEANKAVRLAAIAAEKERAGIDIEEISARETFISTQGKSLTNEQLDELIQGFGFVKADFNIDAEGNWELTNEAIQKGLNELNTAQRNLWKAQVESNNAAALEAIGELGGKIASNQVALQDYINAFGADYADERFGDIFAAVMAGEDYIINGVNVAIEENILNYLKATMPEGATEEEIQQAYQRLVASYKDGIAENIQTIFDTAQKVFDGTASATDLQKLEELKSQLPKHMQTVIAAIISSDRDIFAKANEVIKAAAQEAKTNGWTDDLEETTRAGYQALFDAIEDESDSSEVAFDKIKQAKNNFKSEDIVAALTDVVVKTDEAIELTKEQLTELFFNYDPNTEIWALKDDINIEEFQTVFGEGLTNAFLASVNAEKIDEAIKLDPKKSSIENALIELYTDYQNITLESIKNLYEDIYGEGTFAEQQAGKLKDYQDAVIAARDGNVNGLIKLLEDALNYAQQTYDVNLSKLQIAIQDAQLALINSLIESVQKAVSGSLSVAEYADLAKRFNLSGNYNLTASGVEINADDMRKTIAGAYREAAEIGAAEGLGEKIWSSFQDQTNALFNSYEEIDEEITEINANIEEWADNHSLATNEAEDYLKVLKQIQDASKLSPDNPLFNFMDKESGDTVQTANRFIASIEKVQEAFQAFRDEEPIDIQTFDNIMSFLNSTGQFETFAEKIGQSGTDYNKFVNEIIADTAQLGKIDIGSVAAKLGISVETAMSAMSESMTDGLKQVAQEQIKYLSGLEGMLKAMAALEQIGDIKINLGFDITGDGEADSFSLKDIDQFQDNWEWLSKNNQERFKLIVDATLDQNSSLKEFFSILGYEGNVSQLLFGKDGFSGTSEEFKIASAFGTFITQLSGLTTGQAQTLGIQFRQILAENMEFDETTSEFIGLKENWQEKLLNLFLSSDLSTLPEAINTQIQEAMGKAGLETIELDGGITLKLTNTGIIFEGGDITDDNKAAIIDQIEAALDGIEIGDITLGPDGSYILTPGTSTEQQNQAKEITDALTSIAEAAQVVTDTISSLQDILNTFSISDNFTAFAELWNSLKTSPLESQQDPNAAIPSLIIENAQAIQAITDVETAYAGLVETFKKFPLIISTSFDGALGSLNQIQASQENGQTAPNQAVPLNQVITVTWQATEFPTIPEQEVIYNWKEGTKIPKPSAYKAYFNWSPKNSVSDFVPTTPIAIKYVWEPSNTITKPASTNGGGGGDVDAIAMNWTGTMNSVSGAAFADGSIGRLYSGAQLANKVLVGELGPELAVYDGQYHMLGANGAEFVNLPSDAIVFNHLQTQGILNGQMNIRGTAMAEGNVSGPAYASGSVQDALQQVQRAKAIWQSLLNNLTVGDLLGASGGGGGGGGSGESIKAVTEELQEWYNLSRQIADIEQEINNLLAERANIEQSNGEEYLRNLRKQQQLLEQQIATQQVLVQYQELQLKRQAQLINQNAIWSQFLFVNASGLLQYVSGNEANGGKGALQVLQELNQMSGEQQTAFLQNLGYSYTTADGVALEGAELVEQFFQELQDQIDQYDSLYDTVHESLSILEELETQINDINQEIKENQLELEQAIYDIIVKAWEKEIEQMEKQADVIKEANEAYIESLNEAISEERKLYDENRSIADREQLQRQLSLLRRSGGSAAEIANLETQLDDMLKEEYFNNQEKMIENIEKANEKQIQQLEEQIKIQEEMLEYQKENGVIWTEVYQVMSQSKEAMISFMQGNSPDFFSQSALQQEQMLTEWAHKIGIYNENKNYENYRDYANDNVWNNGAVWNLPGMNALKSVYNSLTAEQQQLIKDQFANAYANARLAGDNNDAAIEKARQAIMSTLTGYQGSQNAGNNQVPTTPSGPAPDSGSSGSGEETATRYKSTYTVTYKSPDGTSTKVYSGSGVGSTAAEAEANASYWLKKRTGGEAPSGYEGWTVVSQSGPSAAKPYLHGGLVDYTGIALVHGSKSRPESFLNADQTQQIQNALKMSGDGGALDSIRDTLSMLNNTIKSIVKTNIHETTTFTVAPGAVTIQVAQLNDAYDVEELSRDVMNRMVDIANKATNRGVSRR